MSVEKDVYLFVNAKEVLVQRRAEQVWCGKMGQLVMVGLFL